MAKLWVTDQTRKDLAQVISLHNGFLRAEHDMMPKTFQGPDGNPRPFSAAETDVLWRHLHTEATKAPRLPDFLQCFDGSRRACWAVVQKPGQVPDSIWAEEAEAAAHGVLVAAPA